MTKNTFHGNKATTLTQTRHCGSPGFTPMNTLKPSFVIGCAVSALLDTCAGVKCKEGFQLDMCRPNRWKKLILYQYLTHGNLFPYNFDMLLWMWVPKMENTTSYSGLWSGVHCTFWNLGGEGWLGKTIATWYKVWVGAASILTKPN